MSFSVRSDVDVEKVRDQFYSDVVELLGKSPYKWQITSGYRSLEEQTKLYEKYKQGGPKAAPPGASAHNYGLAVDVALIVDGKYNWNTKMAGWLWLKSAIWKHPRLHSLWKIGDWPHIERYHWRNFI